MNEERLNELKEDGIVRFHPMTGSYIGNNVYIGPRVQIGRGSIIWPNSFILGDTVIGKNCEIENDVHLEDARIGDNTIVHKGSYITESEIGKGCELWVDQSMYHAILEDEVRVHKGNRIVWSRVGKGTVLEQGCQIKYADVGPDCRICNSLIEGGKLSEEELMTGKRTVTIRYSCAIGPWVVIQGPAEIGPRAEILYQAKIIRSDIGYRTKIDGARIEDSVVSYNCVVDQDAYIHGNSRIESGCKIARCEIANSHIVHGRCIHPQTLVMQ